MPDTSNTLYYISYMENLAHRGCYFGSHSGIFLSKQEPGQDAVICHEYGLIPKYPETETLWTSIERIGTFCGLIRTGRVVGNTTTNTYDMPIRALHNQKKTNYRTYLISQKEFENVQKAAKNLGNNPVFHFFGLWGGYNCNSFAKYLLRAAGIADPDLSPLATFLVDRPLGFPPPGVMAPLDDQVLYCPEQEVAQKRIERICQTIQQHPMLKKKVHATWHVLNREPLRLGHKKDHTAETLKHLLHQLQSIGFSKSPLIPTIQATINQIKNQPFTLHFKPGHPTIFPRVIWENLSPFEQETMAKRILIQDVYGFFNNWHERLVRYQKYLPAGETQKACTTLRSSFETALTTIHSLWESPEDYAHIAQRLESAVYTFHQHIRTIAIPTTWMDELRYFISRILFFIQTNPLYHLKSIQHDPSPLYQVLEPHAPVAPAVQ